MNAEEQRIGLVHRVLIARRGMSEYAILITERRSLFIKQRATRGGFMLRTEILSGSSGMTSAQPKTLADYSSAAIGSLELDRENFSIIHSSVSKMIVGIGGLFPVYHFDLTWKDEDGHGDNVVFYAVPLSTYAIETSEHPREVILREYADSIFRLYQRVIPSSIIENAGLGEQA